MINACRHCTILRNKVVGYQELTVPAGYSLYTVTFAGVDGGDLDIQSVRVIKDGAELATTAEVTIQGMTAGGAYDDDQYYNWRTRSGKTGWHKSSRYVSTENGNAVKVGPSVAWCVNNQTSAPVTFLISGSVQLTPVSNVIAPGYGLYGNMTPNTINIQDIQVYNEDGSLNADTALVTLQGMTTGGAYDDAQYYNWRTRSGKTGWHKSSRYISADNGNDVSLAPGEAFCLNNQTTGNIVLKFTSPIAAE